MMKTPQPIPEPTRWTKVGKSVYQKKTAFVFKEKKGWYMTILPPACMQMCLAAAQLSSLGIFSETLGPFPTMAKAKKAKIQR